MSVLPLTKGELEGVKVIFGRRKNFLNEQYWGLPNYSAAFQSKFDAETAILCYGIFIYARKAIGNWSRYY